MAEGPSEKKLTANELVLQNLKEKFERNGNVTSTATGQMSGSETIRLTA